jgi:hypothetical protein
VTRALFALLLLPSLAFGQGLGKLIDRLEATPFKPEVNRVMAEHRVGGLSLGEYLLSLRFEGCLNEVRDELVAGLDALHKVHVRAREGRTYKEVWRVWDNKLEGLSPDAFMLVQTWLDSPENARRLYFCEDDLPGGWKRLDANGYVLEAVTWFDVAIAEEEAALQRGTAGDREQAVMALIETRSSLIDRFEATFPADESTAVARDNLEERLDLMWDQLIEPYHYGFSRRARTDDPEANSDATRRARVGNPFQSGGVGIPDPRDVAARDQVVRSWKKQQRVLDAELSERQDLLDEALGALRAAEGKRELDAWVREAERLRREIEHTISDIERVQTNVRYYSTGRPWVDDMLSNGFRRRAVRRMSKREAETQKQRVAVEGLIAEAVRRGAEPPPAPGEAVGMTGTTVAGGNRKTGDPGPGNWLAGLPESDATDGTTGLAEVDGIAPGSGWVERRYEGPIPPPSTVWSVELVDAIRNRYPSLDETDVRILLSLVKAAYRELKTREAVEQAMWRSLGIGDGLSIRGEEATLSDLYVQGTARIDQPIITFVLTLYF